MTPSSYSYTDGKAMLLDGKNTTLFKKSGSTIIAIDALPTAYPKSLIFQYAAYIDILAQNPHLIGH
jgi:hypothetical protein